MSFVNEFFDGIDFPAESNDSGDPFRDITDYVCLAHVRPELQPLHCIKHVRESRRSNRAKSYVRHCRKNVTAVALLQHASCNDDQLLRCRGLAVFLEGLYAAQGYLHDDGRILPLVSEAVDALSKQCSMASAELSPTHRPMVTFRGTALEYLLKQTASTILSFILASTGQSSEMPDIISEARKVLDRIEAINEDDPKLLQKMKDVKQEPQLLHHLRMGPRAAMHLIWGGYKLKLNQIRWLLRHTCCQYAKHIGNVQLLQCEAGALAELCPDSPQGAYLMAEATWLGETSERSLSLMHRALHLATEHKDDIVGALSAWHAAQLLASGAKGSSFSVAEIKELIGKAGECQGSLMAWGGIVLVGTQLHLVGSRVRQLIRAARQAGYADSCQQWLKVPKEVRTTRTQRPELTLRSGCSPRRGEVASQAAPKTPRPGRTCSLPCAGSTAMSTPSSAAATPRGGGVPRRPCDRCGMLFVDLLPCQECRKVFYCSKLCQRKHWRVHRQQCDELTRKQMGEVR